MSRLVVQGPTQLRGEFHVPGAKNSVSKLLAASMLTGQACEFHNAPRIADTAVTEQICSRGPPCGDWICGLGSRC